MSVVSFTFERHNFERGYAERAGVTIDFCYKHRWFPAVPCFCEEEGCEGWRRRYGEDDERPPDLSPGVTTP